MSNYHVIFLLKFKILDKILHTEHKNVKPITIYETNIKLLLKLTKLNMKVFIFKIIFNNDINSFFFSVILF